MDSLIKVKEKLLDIYVKYDIYINSVSKFLLTLVLLFGIGNTSSAVGILGNPGIMLIASLVCMFLPKIAISYIVALYALGATFSVSIEFTIVLAFILLLMVLLYMQFSPEYGYLILFAAAAASVNLSLMLVVTAALLVGPAAIVPVICGIIIEYIFRCIPDYMAQVNGAMLESGVEKLKYIAINSLLSKELFIIIAAAIVVFVLVYVIKQSKVNHSWTLAVSAGTVLNFLAILIGSAVVNASVDVLSLIIGTVFSVIIISIIALFVRNLDYKKVERVQFEDDEYYYYVKAIPKKTAVKMAPVKRRVVRENFDEGDA